eukprot:1323011-Pyramimonas_sp.AAC.1
MDRQSCQTPGGPPVPGAPAPPPPRRGGARRTSQECERSDAREEEETADRETHEDYEVPQISDSRSTVHRLN